MDTYLIELTNSTAYRLLQDLEDLKIIRVLKKETQKKQETAKSNSSGFRGALKLSNEQYRDFQQHAKDIRNEWQENI
jgi:CRISPR/Cas system CSM-associated protein Csm2 small subunit